MSDSSNSELYLSFDSSGSNDSFYDVIPPPKSPDLILLGDWLHTTFSPFQRNLNICHINAQSIPAHYDELLSSFNSLHIHICLISESFLKPSLPSALYALPGFVLLRNDRTGKGGGGVAMYIRANLDYKIVVQSPSSYSASSEYLFTELNFNSRKALVGVVYAPPTVNYFDAFESLLEMHIPNYDHCIIMGDFNTCLLKMDSRSKKLENIIKSVNMTILPLSPTHHDPNYSDSLLDLIMISNSDHIATHGQYAAPGFSKHDLIYVSYKIKTPKIKPKLLLQRNFIKMNLEALSNDASKLDWDVLHQLPDVNKKITLFNDYINNLYNKHAPLRLVRMKHAPTPWLNDNIRKAMKFRDYLKRIYKTHPTEANLTQFKRARNRVNQLCRNAKRQYFHKTVSECTQQNVWKTLRSFGIGKARSNATSSYDLNSLNKHFSTPPLTMDPILKALTLSQISSCKISTDYAFNFTPVTIRQIKKILLSVHTKAVGHDGIGRNLLMPIIDTILPPITHIINFSLSTSSFPSIWKKAYVLPTPKKTSPSLHTDFRPICILPFLSKILERVVHYQLSNYMNFHKLFNPFQSGFRPSHSTTSTLLKVTDDIRHAMDKRNLTLLTLIDFSNAFNCVDHDILVAVLGALNMSKAALNWFESYLCDREQRIRVDDVFSDWCPLLAGIPQGGVLSPLLFSIFINTATENIACNYHLYADDLQLYRHFDKENAVDAVRVMNHDLEEIRMWSQKFGLIVNPNKTQVMVVGSREMLNKVNISSLPQISFNNITIPYSHTVKNLGLYINQDLTWNRQVNEISRRVFSTIHALKRFQIFLPFSTKLMLVNTLLVPIIDYADVCYPDITEELLNKLDRLLNLCIRYVFGLRKYDHVSQFRKQLKWLDIRSRRQHHILTLLFGILNNPSSPLYLKERFRFLCSTHNRDLRSVHNNLLAIPAHSSTKYSNSFSVSAASYWNVLPLSLRNLSTVASFKSKLHSYLLLKQNPS